MDDFERRGERLRRYFGIEGGVVAARRIKHPYITDNGYNWCILCGMAYSFDRHLEYARS